MPCCQTFIFLLAIYHFKFGIFPINLLCGTVKLQGWKQASPDCQALADGSGSKAGVTINGRHGVCMIVGSIESSSV